MAFSDQPVVRCPDRGWRKDTQGGRAKALCQISVPKVLCVRVPLRVSRGLWGAYGVIVAVCVCVSVFVCLFVCAYVRVCLHVCVKKREKEERHIRIGERGERRLKCPVFELP